MFKFLLRPILIGLIAAIILLISVPSLRPNFSELPLFSTPKNMADIQLSFTSAVKKAGPAVTNIYSQQYVDGNRLQLQTQGLGSGVIMTESGYILTNYHVVSQADQIVVALQDGRISNVQLIGLDRRTDLAVLKIDLPNLPVIPQNDDYQAAVGDIVLAIGNPYNLGQTTTFGIISATGRSAISADGRQAFIQTDAAINQGNSGGALVNTNGELVGINTASFQQATELETYGISFAIPYDLAYQVMEKIIADGRVIRGYIGIEGQDINPVSARLLGVNYVDGIMITKVLTNSPAHKAGLRPNDIILAVDNQTIKDSQAVMKMVTELRPGTQVSLEVLRQGKRYNVPLTVGEE